VGRGLVRYPSGHLHNGRRTTAECAPVRFISPDFPWRYPRYEAAARVAADRNNWSRSGSGGRVHFFRRSLQLLPTDLVIDPAAQNFRSSGLKVLSVLRLHKVATIHVSSLARRLGHVAPANYLQVRSSGSSPPVSPVLRATRTRHAVSLQPAGFCRALTCYLQQS
jgi:hypothetical protein